MDLQSPAIALKVDVNTYVGTRDGVPRLLHILEKAGVTATFYFSIGPDNTGKAIRRIFSRKGFLRHILRTKAATAYGIRTMLHGILLPPPLIAASFPEILVKTERLGHEVGIHSWDHVKWDDLLPWMPKQTTLMELGRASSLFQEILGRRARTTAAPGWAVSEDSLEIQDAMGLDYCSDTRGTFPFYPVMNGRRFSTLQVPTTLPTIDELLGEKDMTPESINRQYLSLLRPGVNVHTIQAEFEGNLLSPVFTDLLARLKERQVEFVTLSQAAKAYADIAPHTEVAMGPIAGRAGSVALQCPP